MWAFFYFRCSFSVSGDNDFIGIWDRIIGRKRFVHWLCTANGEVFLGGGGTWGGHSGSWERGTSISGAIVLGSCGRGNWTRSGCCRLWGWDDEVFRFCSDHGRNLIEYEGLGEVGFGMGLSM